MSPSLAGAFLNWDDPFVVVNNPAVQQLDWRAILHQTTVGIWHPLTLATFALEVRWLGSDAWHFHAVSVLLHGVASSLAARWVLALHPGRPIPALVAGLLFAVHPLHVESVAWISERKDLLSAALSLGALLAHERFRLGAARGLPWLSLGLFCLALLAKPMAVSVPLILLALDHWRGRRDLGRCLAEKLPYLLLAGVFGLRSLTTQAPAPDEGFEIYQSSLPQRVGLALQALAFYTARLLWPSPLSVYYDRALVRPGAAEWLLALGAGLPWTAAALRRPGRGNGARLALAFYLLTLAPVLKLIPFGGNSAFNDRYVYLPSLGPFLAVALGFEALPWRGRPAQAARGLLLGAVCALLGWRSAERCLVFRDSGSLWRDVLAHYPGTSVALNQLGRHVLDAEGDAARAQQLFLEAHRARPEAVEPLANLAELALRRGDAARAREFYEQALERGPSRVELLRGYGDLLAAQGQLPQARAQLERAAAIERRANPSTLVQLAGVVAAAGDRDGARRLLAEALALAPRLGPAYAALALLELEAGNPAEARSHADAARLLGAPLAPELVERIEAALAGRRPGSAAEARRPTP